jgi:hypothetical protein
VEGPEIFYREAGFDDRTIVIDNAPAGINLSDVHCQPRAANLRCNRADNRNLDRRPANATELRVTGLSYEVVSRTDINAANCLMFDAAHVGSRKAPHC